MPLKQQVMQIRCQKGDLKSVKVRKYLFFEAVLAISMAVNFKINVSFEIVMIVTIFDVTV